MKAIIQVENLSKQYRIGARGCNDYPTLREAIVHYVQAPIRRWRDGSTSANTLWALRDVSFTVNPGETLGIVGRNGAGKSTLLKILSRITEPTTGSVDIYGRVASLLEVGTGFHPELTGRENIFLNGAILGMKRSEIVARFDEIVAFADIERFLDTPVKRYSSGMHARLAFAVAAHLRPDVLIVDEVLAVGDAAFQKKCLGKMDSVARDGRTVLFVSHNMPAVRALCSRCIFMEGGNIGQIGSANEITSHYLAAVLPRDLGSVPLIERKDRTGNGAVRFFDFRVEDASGNPLKTATTGNSTDFVFDYCVSERLPLRQVDVGFSLHTEDGRTVFVFYSSYQGKHFTVSQSQGTFRCRIPRLPVVPGRYRVSARIVVGLDEADWPRDGVGFVEVVAGDFYGSGFSGYDRRTDILVDGSWRQ